MSPETPLRRAIAWGGSPAVAAAYTSAALGFLFLVPLVRASLGWAPVTGAVVALVALGALVVAGSRERIELTGLLPLTVIAYAAWCVLSTLWSDYEGATFSAGLYLLAVGFVGVVIAITRDMIQIVRSVGTVLRVLLATSLVLEIASGIVFDVPFEALQIAGGIADGEPVQGLFVTRNLLGFVTALALVTFVVEWLTRSVPRHVYVGSVALAVVLVIASQSPVTIAVLVTLAVAALALGLVRRAAPASRRRIARAAVAAAVLAAAAGFWGRQGVLRILDATAELDARVALWTEVIRAIDVRPLVGWGWAGEWLGGRAPYVGINISVRGGHDSALNAPLDALLQVGVIGALLLAVLVVTALARSWVLAVERRTLTYAWPALVLVVLIATSMAESVILIDVGWLLLVVCAVRASQSRSWRGRLRRGPLPAPPRE